MRNWAKTIASVACLTALALVLAAQVRGDVTDPRAAQTAPRRPRGIYALVLVNNEIEGQRTGNPSITDAQIRSHLKSIYNEALNNPAVSGLALGIGWDVLNPSPPSNTQPYDWSWLDDVFSTVAAWNAGNPSKTPKTVQVGTGAGFKAPQWIMGQLTSCDGLFTSPPQTPPATCGTATFLGYSEGGGGVLPLPWNPTYKSAFKTFVAAFSAQYGNNPALVSIDVSGPSAASTETILPINANTPPQSQFGGIQPDDMWRKLFALAYPGKPTYQNSDQAFIDEWNAAIDLYGATFNNLTLLLWAEPGFANFSATGFTVASTPSVLKQDCPVVNMDCAAVTQILSHFADPANGGSNAKTTSTAALTALSGAPKDDLGINAVKLLAQGAAQQTLPSAQIMAGQQADTGIAGHPVREGCTAMFPPDSANKPAACTIPSTCSGRSPDSCPVACLPQACLAPGVTPADVAGFTIFANVPAKDLISPEQALYNLLKTYFDGTPAASSFGGRTGTVPLNYLQLYWNDIQYANNHANSPATIVEAGGATATISFQDLLNLASQKLLLIGEPALPPAPSLSIQKTWQGATGANPLRGDAFTYSITVTNGGNAPASNVTVQDTPDSRAELALQGPATFNLGALASGASQTVTVKASAGAAGTYTNTALVTWSDADGNSTTASAGTTTTIGPQPGDLTASATSTVALNTGVRQVTVDSRTVYVSNNPGDSVTILDCTGGACTVTQTVRLAAGANPIAVVFMDVDGDGFNDTLVLNQGTGTVTALLSGSPRTPVTSSVGANPLAFAGFDAGDGVPRIAVTFAGTIGIFAWNGKQFQPSGTEATGQSPMAIVNADFNNDGIDDLLVTNTSAGTVQVWLGDGMGGFNLASEVAVGDSPAALATGDLNNDFVPDAAVITSAGLVLLLNDGMGNLLPQPAIPASGAGAVVLADFDGDGNLDAAVANSRSASVNLYRGDGSGAVSAAGVYLTGKTPVSLAASDLTGSGSADLIVGDSGTQDLTILMLSR